MIELTYPIVFYLVGITGFFHNKFGMLLSGLVTGFWVFNNMESHGWLILGISILTTGILGFSFWRWKDLGINVFGLDKFQIKLYAGVWLGLCTIVLGASYFQDLEALSLFWFSIQTSTLLLGLFLLMEKVHGSWLVLLGYFIVALLDAFTNDNYLSVFANLILALSSIGVYFSWSIDYYSNIKYSFR